MALEVPFIYKNIVYFKIRGLSKIRKFSIDITHKKDNIMDALKILESLINSGALSKGSAGGDVLGSILGAALGGSKNQKTQGGDIFGDILGSLVGGGKTSSGVDMGDLLGGLLGGEKSSTGAGGLGDLLGSILSGGKSSTGAGGLGDLLGSALGGGNPSQSTAKTAKDLEDLLGIGKKSSSTELSSKFSEGGMGNDKATLIIQAMINAAKSDGSIDKAEQEKILSKLGDISKEERDFVRSEFAEPLNVTKFINSVPRGMEEQIYTVSLMAIDLDKNSEARYLVELAKGLRIQPEMANNLHDKLHIPKIFA